MAMPKDQLAFIRDFYASESEDEQPVPVQPLSSVNRKAPVTPTILEVQNLLKQIRAKYDDEHERHNPVEKRRADERERHNPVEKRRVDRRDEHDHVEKKRTRYVDSSYTNKVQPMFKPFNPIPTTDEAFIVVNNQDVWECCNYFEKNRYDVSKLRLEIVCNMRGYRTINGLVVAGHIPHQVQDRWERLEFGVQCYVGKPQSIIDASFTRHVADIINMPKYSKEPQTLVLCFTRNTACGYETLLDAIKKGIAKGWKIIIWSWRKRLDIAIEKYCLTHKSIQLNYLDNVSGIFYKEISCTFNSNPTPRWT